MKIYTKTGDQGTTSLVGGARVSKADERLEAYGTVDELSAFVAFLHDSQGVEDYERNILDKIQECLMTVESHLALEETSEYKKSLPMLTPDNVDFLEKNIDEITSNLEPLKNLIIPGGNILASQSHICRTVCRRAERATVRLNQNHPVETIVLQYLNRLSDFFFVLARYFMKKNKAEVIIWKPNC